MGIFHLDSKTRKLLLITVVTFIAIIIFAPSILVYIQSFFFGKQEIVSTVRMITKDGGNTKTILYRIADWQNKNMVYDSRLLYFYPVPPFVLFRMNEPAWIMTTKRGGCGEYAILFNEMVNLAGIPSRIVYNLSEDHVWCEVLINGSWIPVDGYRFNDPRFYERPRSEGGWAKQLSYVYYLGPDGKQYDITKDYTDTGRLVVQVSKDGFPVENAKVIVKSNFLMETKPNSYKEPRICLDRNTNSSGISEFDLGGNNYTIVAESGIIEDIIGYKEEKVLHLDENNTVFIGLHLSKVSIFLSDLEIVMVLILIILIISIVLEILFLFKKRKSMGNVEGSRKLQHKKLRGMLVDTLKR